MARKPGLMALRRPLSTNRLQIIVILVVVNLLGLSILLNPAQKFDDSVDGHDSTQGRSRGWQLALGLGAGAVADRPDDDDCTGWNPHSLPEHDPPHCLRARQFRQLQAFRTVFVKPDANQEIALRHAERCVLGIVKCPPRPLIVSDFWYAHVAHISLSGEAIWLDPVAARDANYAVFTTLWLDDAPEETWARLRNLSELIHMYWSEADHTANCLMDPRCVRPEDYTPSENPAYRHDLSKIPADEIGKLPAWRIFATSFWGSRPHNYNGNGQNAEYLWGMNYNDGDGEWSYHLLGNKWMISPYNYPGHTWIPISIEQSCRAAPVMSPEDRSNGVLILAKESDYFYHRKLPPVWPEAWTRVVASLADAGMELWSAAKEKEGFPIPDGLAKLGNMPKDEYSRVVASARAMLGIGEPPISPSPFVSVCQGVPAVLPYFGDDPTPPDGWQLYRWGQHGPASQMGEPYVYSYNISDPDDLIRQLRRAISTPIESYVPSEMKLSSVRKRTLEVLSHDWEAEYNALRRASGGLTPAYNQTQIDHCYERRLCHAAPVL